MKAVVFMNQHPERAVPLPRLCGITLLERHVKTLTACGIDTVLAVFPHAAHQSPALTRELGRLPTVVATTAENIESVAAPFLQHPVLLLAGDHIIEKPLLAALVEQNRSTLLVDSKPPFRSSNPLLLEQGQTSAGCAWVQPDMMQALLANNAHSWETVLHALDAANEVQHLDVDTLPTFNRQLWRHRRSTWMHLVMEDDFRQAKTMLVMGAQKGNLDIPAKWLHAPIENRIVARICEYPITPNQLTLITNMAAWSVTWAILAGHIALALIGAALVGILDGLDGKLARVKLLTSRLGEFEHLFDMVFEYSWWLSLGWVLGGGDPGSMMFTAGIALIFCNFGDSMVSIAFWFALGRRHVRTLDNYAPFDFNFRLISGRRNIYVWLLLLCAPLAGLHAALWVCVAWGIITLLVRGGRLIWHTRRGKPPIDYKIALTKQG